MVPTQMSKSPPNHPSVLVRCYPCIEGHPRSQWAPVLVFQKGCVLEELNTSQLSVLPSWKLLFVS